MKHLRLIIFAVLSFVILSAHAQKKHALIIAIGDYDSSQGWNDISSANDVPLIKQSLIGQGFKDENIAILQDKYATSKGIDIALDKLTQRVGPKDIVVIHYSGHGQQIQDLNGDENDGYDEALVPYDAPLFAPDDYDFSRHYSDDKLGEKIFAIRQRAGRDGHVLVILDACHSGTATRGEGKRRGSDVKCERKGYMPTAGKNDDDLMKEMGGNTRGQSTGLAKFVLISGSSAYEVNWECKDDNGKSVGSLTYSISKAFADLKSGSTYRQIFAKVMDIMGVKAPRQTPVIEGDIDFVIFNGTLVPQHVYFEIVESNVYDHSKVNVRGGALTGLNLGDKVGFYPAGTQQISNLKPLFTGKVSYADHFSSTIQLDAPTEVSNKSSYWVFVLSKNVDKKMRVECDIDDKNALKLILDTIRKMPQIQWVEKDGDVRITHFTQANKNRNMAVLFFPSDSSVYLEQTGAFTYLKNDGIARMAGMLNAISQVQFIKELEFEDSQTNVDIELIPVKANVLSTGGYEIKEKLDPAAVFGEMKIGRVAPSDQFLFKAKNTGTRTAFVSIIGIQPDGKMYPVFPRTKQEAVEFSVNVGQEREFSYLIKSFSPPFGTETFKIFVSDVPIDLSPLFMKQDEIIASRGSMDILNGLLTDYRTGTRGADGELGISTNASGSVKQITIRVDPNLKR
ncbi:MAG: caspase family protein [Candidatus Competibacteraceae bacterium]|nr:caspase family protein [Candidatus Competibacteraceae bacterium]